VTDRSDPQYRLEACTLDQASVQALSRDVERDRAVAIYDLLEKNHFQPAGSPGGPYLLILSAAENRLVFDVRLSDGQEHGRVMLALSPLRRAVRDYLMMCESYHVAIREAQPARIESIDMGRRGLHDDGSRLLQERLKGKIEVDFETARRLFTLISALHLSLKIMLQA
jgi:uncharacterized protein (UPF0262 family)